jgi:sulfur carrier protein
MKESQTLQEVTRVFVNDRPHELVAPAMLMSLLGTVGWAERKGIAVALNNELVPRSEWATRELTAGDRVIVIQATQGG